jgi:hypothetical protein
MEKSEKSSDNTSFCDLVKMFEVSIFRLSYQSNHDNRNDILNYLMLIR